MPLEFQRPLIVIGAGRSGSTLLGRTLNSHAQISFKGETSFLVPRLWLELWEDRFWFKWDCLVSSDPGSSRDPVRPISEEIVSRAKERTATAVARLFVSVLDLHSDAGLIRGFKEPWNGSPSFQYDWAVYDCVFSKAVWLHLIRNPFEFARSCAQWNCDGWTLPYLQARLSDWVSMLEWNRQRAATGRYFEMRFEDLITDPEAYLTSIFRYVGLDWDASCLQAMTMYVMQSRARRWDLGTIVSGIELEKIVDNVPGLRHVLVELEYSIPEEIRIESPQPQSSSRDDSGIRDWRMSGRQDNGSRHLPRQVLEKKARSMDTLQNEVSSLRSRLLERERSHSVIIPETIKLKTEILTAPFAREGGHCWITNMKYLEEYADVIDHPFRSPLVLLENGQTLPMPHALHDEIRVYGAGRYSHWNSYLYFSASDNSDPNTNGRKYAIRFA
jgi:hypothetical protein